MRALLAAALVMTLLPAAVRAQDPVAAPPPAAAPAPTAPPEAYPAQPAPPPAYPAQPAPPPAYPAQPAPYPGTAPPPGAAPPGYGYGYPMVDPARAQAAAELQAIDLRLGALRQQQAQHSIGGPIAMTAAGFGILVIFGAVSLSQFALAEDIEHGDCAYYVTRDAYYDSRCDVNDDGTIDGDDVDRARMLSRTFGVLSGVAGAVGIAGAVLLGLRRAERSVYTPELKALGQRRKQLLRELKYGGYPVQYGGGMVLTVGARF